MRPLTLHVSALSDAEYDLYTSSLDDLASDVRDYESCSVGVREARAWLRGRYSDLPASDIDAILKFFCPSMLPSDTLTGGQFFAALRLVLHAKSGKPIDRALAFVQGRSISPRLGCRIHHPLSTASLALPQPSSPPKLPPSHPDRQRPPPAISSPETNPFTRRSMEHAATALVPEDPPALPPFPQSRPGKLSQNPFLARDRPSNASNTAKLPPLPPRKPPLLAAPRRTSDALPTAVTTAGLPLVPAKPTHVVSPLMRQSLEASKHAQSMKRAEEQLDRERVLQVLKTSSSGSSVSSATPGTRTRSLSPAKLHNGHGSASGSDDATFVPPLPRRRKPSHPSSSSGSALSLEQVASAKLPSPLPAPFRPPLPNRDVVTHSDGTGLGPPPTHPNRRPSNSMEPAVDAPCVARSRSVTSSSSPSVMPPPPRRKRPESVQLPTPDMDGFPNVHSRTTSFQGLSRHPSLREDSPMTNLQRTLTHLQLKAQPRLDAVRYKAEAGISKRGYIHGVRREEGEQGLMTDTNVDPDSAPTTDEEPIDKNAFRDSDHLKWPMGEGWKPL